MEFGVFDHLDLGAVPLGEHYENRLQLIEAYDRLGLRSYHLAEHHATPLGSRPRPACSSPPWRSARAGCASGRWSTPCRCTILCASPRRSACSTR